ncbi:hypothetical protein JTE90_023033 [Oedothorax gibbosus]|uniref:Eukaryotic translation initiation factor 5B n=1 Tax=Oedothorax gibbosus TaxID=931172 RepID=A0AAV6V2I6_9ARAC|nr:hypothetical protein JTE90_023033 [Oedothorax gibbosus]
MGKNRKVAKQVSSRADTDDLQLSAAQVLPCSEEFLTSDDFKIVQKKRHHSSNKKLPEQGGFHTLPRSRSNSERFVDDDSSQGCHSGFWTVRSHQNLNLEAGSDSDHQILKTGSFSEPEKEYNSEPEDSSIASEDSHLVNYNPSGVHLNGVKNSNSSGCNKEGVTEYGESLVADGIENSIPNGVHLNGQSSIEALSIENGHGIVPNDHVANGDSTADDNGIRPVLVRDISTDLSDNHQSKCNDIKKKKKGKKIRDRQKKIEKSDSSPPRRRSESQVLVSSSSSDFSEMPNAKAKDVAKKAPLAGVGERKRPSKKQLAAIHDALRKAKEDEERRKQEEEVKRRSAEEAEKREQERLRQEQEKKERKKLKEKQKREKMRAEGKLLSKSQKQSRARLEATLEAFRQQGVDVPQIGEKRPRGPRLGSFKQSSRKRLDSSQSVDSGIERPERYKSASLSSQESSGKESISDLPSSFESKEDIISALELHRHFSCSEESDALCEERSDSIPAQKLVSPTDEKEKHAKVKDVDAKTATAVEKVDEVKLRSPVICVLGHVDTGKTKLLDYIRRTHIQDSEAGGITQQIGATMIPRDALKEKCKMVKNFSSLELKVPGLLVIDTPGHESFRNLRSRGSSICDIAILVVDIMHGLEPQTLESISLLKSDKIPFVVALNKIDRLFGWKSHKDEDIESVIAYQSSSTFSEFQKRCQQIVLQFANECLNATLFYENPDPRSFVSMVPVSAITGDGMGNLLSLVTQLTQSMLHKKLVFSDELQATVLEVKAIPGLGTTIDVILVNGRLNEGDTIVLASQEGPFVAQIRSLLMPQPLKELRVKNPYTEHKSIEGAQGVKITGKDLDKTLAGLPLFVANNTNKLEDLKSKLSGLLSMSVNYIKTSERGVHVQASTLGSLEALLEYLGANGVSYVSVKIGPVVKKDVMKASIMLEHDVQYAAILAFDVKVERDAQELADSAGVKIFHANIIYHLCDEYVLYRDELQKKRAMASQHFIYPCILKVLPKDNDTPKGLFKVLVEAGIVYCGTPLCIPSKSNMEVGNVASVGGKEGSCAREGEEVTIGLDYGDGDPKVFGTDYEEGDYMVSRITKQSIEVCKEFYKDELGPEDWQLIGALKQMLHLHV